MWLGLPLFGTGCAQLDLIQTDLQASRGETAALSRKLDSVRTDVRSVNQKLSDQGVKSGDEVSRTRADLQLAISQLTAEMQKITAQLENNQMRMGELDKQLGQLRSRPVATGRTDSGKAPSGASPLENALNTAQEDFAKGRFDLAYRGFSEVAGKDSSGVLAPQALYKMGECRYAQANLDEAKTLYQRVVREYSKDPARCPAQFKLGLVYERQGSNSDRDEAWNKLQKACPGSNEAQRAKDLQTIVK